MIYQKTLNDLHPHSYLCDSTFASLPTKGEKKNQQFLCAAVNRIYAVQPAFLTFPHVQRLTKKKKKEPFLSLCNLLVPPRCIANHSSTLYFSRILRASTLQPELLSAGHVIPSDSACIFCNPSFNWGLISPRVVRHA